jgi:hypothetical protein
VCASVCPTGRIYRIPVAIIGAAALRLRIALLEKRRGCCCVYDH